jgi:hypothetical protein
MSSQQSFDVVMAKVQVVLELEHVQFEPLAECEQCRDSVLVRKLITVLCLKTAN